MIRRITYLVLGLAASIAISVGATAQQASIFTSESDTGRVCELENSAFYPGERIVYKLYYNLNFFWISAGEVEFNIEDIGDAYKLTAVGKTYPSYEWFFKVHDIYESIIDKETLLPKLTIRDISEGNYTLYERVEYDQESGVGIGYRGRNKTEAMQRPGEFTMDYCFHDVLSAVYFMRNLNFESTRPDTEFPITVFMDRKEYPLGVRYLGEHTEKRIKGLGHYDVYELAPEVVAGDVFSEESEMRVWASTNGNHVPLQIESPLSVGSVKAILKSHSNLKHGL